MKDAVIIGTRPEIIKCAPVIKEYARRGEKLLLVHTNQHYSFNMDKVFFEDLDLREPDHNLNVGSGSHAIQTGKIMAGIESLLHAEGIDRILVQGDTNTVLGATLAAVKLGVAVGHIEAGLRSHDRSMPEEINRILTDHVSSYLFCPTTLSKENVLSEGIDPSLVHVVGNTIVDATLENFKIASEKNAIVLERLGVKPGEYVLLTAHRPANVDSKERLAEFIQLLELIANETDHPIIFPAHPRTINKMNEFGMGGAMPASIKMIDPLGYLDFLVLEGSASLILTDSGGIQEEACILKIPCITLRENTERPETLEVGSNVLVGYDGKKLLDAMRHFNGKKMEYEVPFGKGDTAKQIFDILH